jgi:hypothetical protein
VQGFEALLAPLGEKAKYYKLLIAILLKAIKDLDHPRAEVREDAWNFLVDLEDTGLTNLMSIYNMDGAAAKDYFRKRLQERD